MPTTAYSRRSRAPLAPSRNVERKHLGIILNNSTRPAHFDLPACEDVAKRDDFTGLSMNG
jgi:hypothetical protein